MHFHIINYASANNWLIALRLTTVQWHDDRKTCSVVINLVDWTFKWLLSPNQMASAIIIWYFTHLHAIKHMSIIMRLGKLITPFIFLECVKNTEIQLIRLRKYNIRASHKSFSNMLKNSENLIDLWDDLTWLNITQLNQIKFVFRNVQTVCKHSKVENPHLSDFKTYDTHTHKTKTISISSFFVKCIWKLLCLPLTVCPFARLLVCFECVKWFHANMSVTLLLCYWLKVFSNSNFRFHD